MTRTDQMFSGRLMRLSWTFHLITKTLQDVCWLPKLSHLSLFRRPTKTEQSKPVLHLKASEVPDVCEPEQKTLSSPDPKESQFCSGSTVTHTVLLYDIQTGNN